MKMVEASSLCCSTFSSLASLFSGAAPPPLPPLLSDCCPGVKQSPLLSHTGLTCFLEELLVEDRMISAAASWQPMPSGAIRAFCSPTLKVSLQVNPSPAPVKSKVTSCRQSASPPLLRLTSRWHTSPPLMLSRSSAFDPPVLLTCRQLQRTGWNPVVEPGGC